MEAPGGDAIVQIDDCRHLAAVFRRKSSRNECRPIDHFRIDNFVQTAEDTQRHRQPVDVVGELRMLAANVHFACRCTHRSHQVLLNEICHPGGGRRVICFRLEHLVSCSWIDMRNRQFPVGDGLDFLLLCALGVKCQCVGGMRFVDKD